MDQNGLIIKFSYVGAIVFLSFSLRFIEPITRAVHLGERENERFLGLKV